MGNLQRNLRRAAVDDLERERARRRKNMAAYRPRLGIPERPNRAHRIGEETAQEWAEHCLWRGKHHGLRGVPVALRAEVSAILIRALSIAA